jgi:hypothetical protein
MLQCRPTSLEVGAYPLRSRQRVMFYDESPHRPSLSNAAVEADG